MKALILNRITTKTAHNKNIISEGEIIIDFRPLVLLRKSRKSTRCDGKSSSTHRLWRQSKMQLKITN